MSAQTMMWKSTKMFLCASMCVLMLGAAGLDSAVQAADPGDDLLAMMPDETLAALVVPNPTALGEKLTGLGEALGQPIPNPITMPFLLGPAAPMVGELDLERPVAVILLPDGSSDNQRITGMIYFPVKDFDAFATILGAEEDDLANEVVAIDLFGNDMVATELNGYALVVDNGDSAYFEAARTNDGAVAETFGSIAEDLGEGDIVVGAMNSGIEMWLDAARDIFEQMQSDLQVQGMDESIVDALGIYFMLFDLIEDNIDSGAARVSIEKNAIVVREIVQLTPGGIGEELGGAEPLGDDWLNTLPGGTFVLTGVGTSMPGLEDEIIDLYGDMTDLLADLYGMEPDAINTLLEQSKPLLANMQGMSFYMGVPRGESTSLYSAAGGIVEVEGGAEAYLDMYADIIYGMSEGLTGEGMIGINKVQRRKFDDKPGLLVEMQVNLGDMFGEDAPPELADLTDKLYGPGGVLTVRMVAVDEDTIAFSYTSPRMLRRMMAIAQGEVDPAKVKPLAERRVIAAIANQLPDDVQMVALIDIKGYRDLVAQLVPMIEMIIPEMKSSPIGIGVTMDKNVVTTDTVIPIQTILNIGEVVEAIAEQAMASEEMQVLPAPDAEEGGPFEL
jgi:hypothetical protein